jgi:2-hydroxy-6-oxonona-2,4-dienedioate hydrolase
VTRRRWLLPTVGLALLGSLAWATHARYASDLRLAAERAGLGSEMLNTACGPIEVQQAGRGRPVLMVHGSGGGHDQGMAWARPLLMHGVHVVAVSRFGYLGTPRPADASPEAQADAHICVLDALGIERATVIGVSAGAASAVQAAIRHPSRVSALVLAVPILFKPADVAQSAPAVPDQKDAWLLHLLGSDVLFWTGMQLARGPVIRHVLATPPDQVAAASADEQARVNELLSRILPVSLRAAGLRDDTRLGKRLGAYPLQTVLAPTLVVSARDDGFGTFAAAEFTASQIPGARFMGFQNGGHLLVGHDAAVRAAVVELMTQAEADQTPRRP